MYQEMEKNVEDLRKKFRMVVSNRDERIFYCPLEKCRIKTEIGKKIVKKVRQYHRHTNSNI